LLGYRRATLGVDAAHQGDGMTSIEIAGVVMAVVAVLVAPVAILTVRYKRYEERRVRGKRHLRPVWKPFWME
jgi:hypothetical protein